MAAKLQSTKDYSLFRMTPFNRDLGSLKKLIASMRNHGWIDAYPMHVVREDGHLTIKGGHHRFEAAKTLGIPVKYVVCSDEASIFSLEDGSRQWRLADYLAAYVKAGYEEYNYVVEFMEYSGFPMNISIGLLSNQVTGSSNVRAKFIRGDFEVTTIDFAYEVAIVAMKVKNLNLEFATHSNFVKALAMTMKVPGFDTKAFMKRLESGSEFIGPRTSREGYLEMIEQVYNFRTTVGKRMPVKFLAEQESKARSVAQLKPTSNPTK